MAILFSLFYYGTLYHELLGKISGKKNMRNTPYKIKRFIRKIRL